MRVFALELNNDSKGIQERDAYGEELILKPDTKAGLRAYERATRQKQNG